MQDRKIDDLKRWKELDRIFSRQGTMVGSNFIANENTRQMIAENIRILVVGAGGLGCELLKDLTLSGFVNIDVIDMDTIEISNLNRQFLFRMEDVGKSKAKIAAERINKRVLGAKVIPHFCRIEDKEIEFYEDFHLFVLGLDSLEARRYMNSIICNFLKYDEDNNIEPLSVKPIIDGGTEGFKGHARVIIPGTTPCFECTLWLFPPQITFPMCTLAETPRNAAHCVEYVHLVLWNKKRGIEEFDADKEEHIKWVYENALERAEFFGISGVTYQYTQGVVKNIIPAIASTNAIISASCTLEALKIITAFSKTMNNYMMYMGTDGIYAHTNAYEKDECCPVCSPGIPFEINKNKTLKDLIDALLADAKLGSILKSPSLSYGKKLLYMRGVLEKSTRENLDKKMIDLVHDSNALLQINDENLNYTLRLRLIYKD